MMDKKRISPDRKPRKSASLSGDRLGVDTKQITIEEAMPGAHQSETSMDRKTPTLIDPQITGSDEDAALDVEQKDLLSASAQEADFMATSSAATPVSDCSSVPGDESVSPMDPVLLTGANEISVPLSAESIRAFLMYANLLKEWNEKMNLTTITDDKGIATRHFIDSLTLIPHLEQECLRKGRKSLTLIDVGTGAGFPGIPLKVAMDDLEVTLLDSLQKRVRFLDAVCVALGLTGIQTLHSRAEDAGRSRTYREKYDVATARAVATLPVLCEYCLPFVKIGGIFLAMKGNVEEEAEASKKAIVSLGGTLETLHHFTLPGTDMKRSIIVIRKVRATPTRYPRQAGKPEKEPIL
jgi:16S rRNA (guanine527-N7)-methyltransferase